MKSKKLVQKTIFILFTAVLVIFPILYTMRVAGMFQTEPVLEQRPELETGKVLHVSADCNFAPYSYLGKNGEPVGYDVETIMEIGRRLGYRVDVRLMLWPEAVSSLRGGYADIIMGKEISPLNAADDVLVTVPTAEETMVVWGRSRALGIDQLQGKRVGVISASTYDNRVRIISGCELVEMHSYDELFKACDEGKLDYVLCRRTIANAVMRRLDISLREGPAFMVSYLGYGALKEKALIPEINRVIQEMREDGTLQEYRRKWLFPYMHHWSLKGILLVHRDVYSALAFLWVLWIFCAFWMWQNGKSIRQREEQMLAYEAERKKQARDLEQAKQEAEKANEAKSKFLFNMSHDIRTPMNAILGFADLLKKHGEDAEKRERYVENIQISGKYLLDLINNVLEMAKIESGKLFMDEQNMNLHEFSRAMDLIFHDACKNKGLQMKLDVDVQHPNVFADKTKCGEIVMNLVSNSVKYTPNGGQIHVKIREFTSQREGWMNCNIVVEDNGIGMSKEFLKNVFESFARERTFTENKIVGTGLGMGIVKHLVDAMDGSIRIESEIKKGTKVFVVLPMRLAEETAVREEESLPDPSFFKGKRVLLAEDNALNAEFAYEMLEDAGFYVEHAEDGVACIDMLESSPEGYYDVVLMDVQMPNMDGYQATRMIRQFEDIEKSKIPIIAVTANVFDEDAQRALSAGMDGFVGKPIELQKLLAELKRFLVK